MKRNRIWFLLAILGLFLFEHCSSIDIEPIAPPEDRYPIDSVEVMEYLQKKGYALEDIDTTANEGYYLVLDEGDGELLEDFDIATIDYTIRRSDDSILWTTRRPDAIEYGLYRVDTLGLDTTYINGVIDQIVVRTDTLVQYEGDRFVDAFKYTVTASTETVPQVLSVGYPSHQLPFAESLVAIVRGSRLGAKGVMILLSERYYGGGFTALSTGLLIIEVYPTFVRKADR